MDVWNREELKVAVSCTVFRALFRHPESFIVLICFGSALKQLAIVERSQHLAGNRSCAKMHNLQFD